MCLALPARVVEIPYIDVGIVDLGGIRKRISISLVPEVQVGDYVIIHVGYSIGLLDTDEAESTLRLFAQFAQ